MKIFCLEIKEKIEGFIWGFWEVSVKEKRLLVKVFEWKFTWER